MQWKLVFPFSELAPLLTGNKIFNFCFFIPQEKPYSSPLGIACEKNHPQVANLLIKNGANINYKDDVCDNYHFSSHTFKECFPRPQYGKTPLHHASKEGNPEVVKVLVQSHANMNIKSNVSTELPH